MSNPVPSSLALTTIADNSFIVASSHRSNYAQIQAALNALITALSNGTAGQLLSAVDSSDVQWSSSLSLSGAIMGAFLGITWGSGLTIASGAVTVTSSGHGINTTDGSTVITINGHSSNPILFLENNAGQTIKFGTGGNIASAFQIPIGSTAFLVWAANLAQWVGVTVSPGSGGQVTQATSRNTAVTLNNETGQITTSAASLGAGASASFQVNNSLVGANDLPYVVPLSSSMLPSVSTSGAGAFTISYTNTSGSPRSSAEVFQFKVLRGAIS